MAQTALVDRFVLDRLPPPELLPEFLFELPELQYPERLNCAGPLLDRWVATGGGERVALRAPGLTWTYRDLWVHANRVARVLTEDFALQPGNRVLLRAPNHPMLAACWFGVVKAGGVVVTTMPLLRQKELTDILTKAEVSHVVCDVRLREELDAAVARCPWVREVVYFGDDAPGSLEARMARKTQDFQNVDTACDDPVLIAFTSGTTGKPKGCVHFHRDVLAICDTFARHVVRATPDDVFIGSPPLAFTYGLGGLLVFPLRIGASSVLLERAGPDELLEGIERYGATVCFTAPTAYRAMAPKTGGRRPGQLRKCVSAGEVLPASTRLQWREATGIEILDGIGSTEMLHIFISHTEEEAKPGATGKPVPGYRACVLDDEGRPLPAGTVGRLAVRGPTGCRYLDDPRQRDYVQGGWNVTGDAYLVDEDGYFVYQARTDDLIISAGYNIAPAEVEEALLTHPAVAECGVVGVPDPERGQVVRAYVVLRPGFARGPEMVRELQEHVKARLAPYKYPRQVEFCGELPRTETGKLQRFRLREWARGGVQ
ncbi:MAG: benzoate-CoA ligase family protein [Armatimonadota bacterium]|nr:benzoate-CoA ligase family protein [Armatimonadota bacterium]MDR7526027.1 benzoate-CoA ligase family protein [Armatimonadota bacterium]MDR7531637.1 benzoate-CoA ligase family protein [Armatimonadota bacterium]MDR7566521.1 benzoate-CoA ligase family protein [Armatimonadota bacterium]MDR7590960.1 benzoate-CoA ligase family protein [Armatimonadota bacterium]